MPGPWCRHSRCSRRPAADVSCSKTSPPGAALYTLRRSPIAATSMPLAAGSGWTSPAAPICSAAKAALREDLLAGCAARVCAAAAIADAPGAAWAVARTVKRRSCRQAAPGWRWRLCPWRRSVWTPKTVQMLERLGLERIGVSIPCRAGRWSRALATRSPNARSGRGPGRRADRAARRRRRTAPSWPSPSRSPRPTRSRR